MLLLISNPSYPQVPYRPGGERVRVSFVRCGEEDGLCWACGFVRGLVIAAEVGDWVKKSWAWM